MDKMNQTERATVTGTVSERAVLNCNPPKAYPPLVFSWYWAHKKYPDDFVLATSMYEPHMFISQNGKLYFSTLLPESFNYRCVVMPRAERSMVQFGPAISLEIKEVSMPALLFT